MEPEKIIAKARKYIGRYVRYNKGKLTSRARFMRQF